VKNFNVRVCTVLSSRINGLCWAGPENPGQDDTAPASKGDAPASTQELMDRFMRDNCRTDTSPGAFINLRTRNGPDGAPVTGFAPKLVEWCRERKLDPPDVFAPDFDWSFLPMGVTFEYEKKKQIIKGLGLRRSVTKHIGVGDVTEAMRSQLKKPHSSRLHSARHIFANLFPIFLERLLDVTIHLGVFFIFFAYCITFNDFWGWLNVPSKGVYTHGAWRAPFGWGDFQTPDFGMSVWHHTYVIGLVDAAFTWNIIFVVCYALGFLLSVIEARLPKQRVCRLVITAIREILGVMALFYWFSIFFIITFIFAWVVLAACAYPNSLLPIGSTMVGAIYACQKLHTQSMERIKMLKEKIIAAQDEVLQVQIHEALSQIRHTKAASGSVPVDQVIASVQAESSGARRRYDASDVFLAVDEEKNGLGDGTLTYEEVETMFRAFKLKVNSSEIDQFFAYCDTDGSGSISADEFQAGWEYFTDCKLSARLSGFGISQEEAFVAAILALAVVVVLGVFVVTGIQAIAGEGSFEAVVQSLIIGYISNTTGNLRKEASKNDEGIVEAVLREDDNEA